MRYDIELNITDILDSAGKEKLADMLFNEVSTLKPATFNNLNITNIEPIDLGRYKFKFDESTFSSLSPFKYISRIENDTDFSLSRLMIKHGKFIPFLKPGTAYFYNYPIYFSYGAIRRNIDFIDYATETQPVCCGYAIQIPEDINYESIKIFSINMPNNDIPQIENLYSFIDSSIISVDIIHDKVPEVYHRNRIIISIINDEVDGIYSTLINRTVRKVFSKEVIVTGSIKDSKLLLSNNGMALVDLDNNIIINRKNDKLYNFKHQSIFNTSSIKNLYLIDRNPIDGNLYVFLNTNRMLFEQQFVEENITIDNPNRYIFFNKYPLSNVGIYLYENQIIDKTTIGIYNTFSDYSDNNNYEDYLKFVFNDMGMAIINTGKLKENGNSIPISVAGIINATVMPMITYSRENTFLDNSRHLLYDVSSLETNFTNGTICLASNEISNNTLATKLEFLYPNGKEINWLSALDIKVKLTNDDNFPIPNKIINIKLNNTLNNSVKLSSASSYDGINSSVRTNILGEAVVSLMNSNITNYAYIQKEWVNNTKITIPYKIPVTNKNNIFLFMVTGDDPLQSQLKTKNINGIGSEFFEIPTPYDYYTRENDISSYYIEGRKIAYVSLQAGEQITDTEYKVTSKFVKPISINSYNDTVSTSIRRCYIYNTLLNKFGKTYSHFGDIRSTYKEELSNFRFTGQDYIFITNTSQRFDNNWLLNNNSFTFSPIKTEEYTEIEFENIPGFSDTNVIGYYIRYIPDINTVTVNASYIDGNFNTSLKAISDEILIGTSVSSEEPLTLSTEPDVKNSYLGPYSYLTLTDYLNSNCESTCTQYICKYSSSVLNGTTNNRCSHASSAIRNYYIPNDNANLFCKHTVEYDLTLPLSQQCPGLDEQLINPFILYSE
jgi:hypothetical protein